MHVFHFAYIRLDRWLPRLLAVFATVSMGFRLGWSLYAVAMLPG